jgi:hypothetical protein
MKTVRKLKWIPRYHDKKTNISRKGYSDWVLGGTNAFMFAKWIVIGGVGYWVYRKIKSTEEMTTASTKDDSFFDKVLAGINKFFGTTPVEKKPIATNMDYAELSGNLFALMTSRTVLPYVWDFGVSGNEASQIVDLILTNCKIPDQFVNLSSYYYQYKQDVGALEVSKQWAFWGVIERNSSLETDLRVTLSEKNLAKVKSLFGTDK